MTQLVRQPDDSTICGQCCVAMLTGASLRKVINLVGHKHGTKTKELAKVIRRLGYDCGDRLVRFKNSLRLVTVERALLKLTPPEGRNWHWVVWADHKVYDPCHHEPIDSVHCYISGRVTSFLEVTSGSGWAPVQMVQLGRPQ